MPTEVITIPPKGANDTAPHATQCPKTATVPIPLPLPSSEISWRSIPLWVPRDPSEPV